MKMTNNEIYTYTRQLMDAFQDGEQKLPIKINFYLQKNKNTLLALAQDIEKARLEIAQNYGTLNESGEQFIIPSEKIDAAAKELEDLFTLFSGGFGGFAPHTGGGGTEDTAVI